MSTAESTGIPEPVTKRGQATKRALLDAAEEVFGENSYERASIAEITRRAGVAQGTFYLYFPDKSAVFVELVRKLNHGLRQYIATRLEGVEGRIAAERQGLLAFFEYAADHRALYKVVREAEFVDEDIYRWHYQTLTDGYVRGLTRAMESGEIADDISPETMALAIMGINQLLGSMWVIVGRSEPPEQVIDEIMTFIARGVGARTEVGE